jgi:uncharacterized cysteine cluster protein YcgN (CxxCxxCC family)
MLYADKPEHVCDPCGDCVLSVFLRQESEGDVAGDVKVREQGEVLKQIAHTALLRGYTVNTGTIKEY